MDSALFRGGGKTSLMSGWGGSCGGGGGEGRGEAGLGDLGGPMASFQKPCSLIMASSSEQLNRAMMDNRWASK
jgi:hypothetical protein